MRYKKRELYKAFDGKLVGNFKMKQAVCDVLVNMPSEVVVFITKNCWFMSSINNSLAYVFKGNDLKDQFLIFLSDELFMQSKNQIRYTIAHEIGHVFLGHNNSTSYIQTREEIRRQEQEADIFARQYI